MVDDFLVAGRWLLQSFTSLWSALGTWQFLGFAVIFFPILRKLVRLFKSLIDTI